MVNVEEVQSIRWDCFVTLKGFVIAVNVADNGTLHAALPSRLSSMNGRLPQAIDETTPPNVV